jgi:hypothetical protein
MQRLLAAGPYTKNIKYPHQTVEHNTSIDEALGTLQVGACVHTGKELRIYFFWLIRQMHRLTLIASSELQHVTELLCVEYHRSIIATAGRAKVTLPRHKGGVRKLYVLHSFARRHGINIS